MQKGTKPIIVLRALDLFQFERSLISYPSFVSLLVFSSRFFRCIIYSSKNIIEEHFIFQLDLSAAVHFLLGFMQCINKSSLKRNKSLRSLSSYASFIVSKDDRSNFTPESTFLLNSLDIQNIKRKLTYFVCPTLSEKTTHM